MFVPDPEFYLFRIPDPTTVPKEEEKCCCPTGYWYNYHVVNDYIFEQVKKNFLWIL
jgi:hypothetical protein